MGKIGTVEKSLSAEELHNFCNYLAGVKNLTLKKMQAEARKLGIELSHSAAGRFKQNTFSEHLEKLRKARELADQVAEFNSTDSVGTLADAGAALLAQQAYDEITSGNAELDSFSKILSRLRSGDHRQREVNAKLERQALEISKLKREIAERIENNRKALNSIKKDKSLSKETLESIELQLKLL